MPQLEPKTGRFSPGEISQIEKVASPAGREVMHALLRARLGAFEAAAPQFASEIEISNFSEALRALVKVGLLEVHHMRLELQYQRSAELMAHLVPDEAVEAMARSTKEAYEADAHQAQAYETHAKQR